MPSLNIASKSKSTYLLPPCSSFSHSAAAVCSGTAGRVAPTCEKQKASEWLVTRPKCGAGCPAGVKVPKCVSCTAKSGDDGVDAGEKERAVSL
eukprot:2012637-Rhodomonas_salina.1